MLSKQVKVIQALGSSQGSVAVVAALLASFGYAILETVDPKVFHNHPWLSAVFMMSSVAVVTGNIFVAIVCSISEQQSKIAAGMSILRSDSQYDLNLETWWRQFADLRQMALWVFFFSIPLLFVAMACSCVLDVDAAAFEYNGSSWSSPPGSLRPMPDGGHFNTPPVVPVRTSMVAYWGAAFFLLGGITCFVAVMHINVLFRHHVLKIEGTFSSTKIDSTSKVLVYTGNLQPERTEDGQKNGGRSRPATLQRMESMEVMEDELDDINEAYALQRKCSPRAPAKDYEGRERGGRSRSGSRAATTTGKAKGKASPSPGPSKKRGKSKEPSKKKGGGVLKKRGKVTVQQKDDESSSEDSGVEENDDAGVGFSPVGISFGR